MWLHGHAASPSSAEPARFGTRRQDMAKSFAGCTNGKTKYELYIEATGFDQIIIELAKARLDVDSMKDNRDVMQASVEARPAGARRGRSRILPVTIRWVVPQCAAERAQRKVSAACKKTRRCFTAGH
jgi:hypothetical protein